MSILRTRRQTLAGAGALALASVGLVGVATAQAAPERERHPHLRAALHEMREAKRELEKADHDFNGHRVEALKALEHAIVQLEKALRSDVK
jgi:hypothetical protein